MERIVLKSILSAISLCVSISAAADLPLPVTDSDYYSNGAPGDAKVALGKKLFFDKIMSGNKNISCATCHSPYIATGDGLSLGLGEGGKFIGIMRTTGEGSLASNGADNAVKRRIGRHAPALFNLGAQEFTNMGWGGVHEVTDGKFNFPGVIELTKPVDNILAAQALFPIINQNEMLGHPGENDAINATVAPLPGQTRKFTPNWNVYLGRLKANTEYVNMFKAAFSDVTSSDKITISHYANAVSAFQTVAFRADKSPFDAYLRGDVDALSPAQVRGMDLFYGNAGCSTCHAGKFQTDHKFYAIAVPTLGKGPDDAFPNDDIGRMEKGKNVADKYKFKVPSLRNVAYTAPYGHSGAYATLDSMIRHHLDPVTSLSNYDTTQAMVQSRTDLNASDFTGYNDLTLRNAWATANQLVPSSLTEAEIADLIAFLQSLTDPASLDLRRIIPATVPSGLAVGD